MIVKIGDKIFNSTEAPIFIVMHEKEIELLFSNRPKPGNHLKAVFFDNLGDVIAPGFQKQAEIELNKMAEEAKG